MSNNPALGPRRRVVEILQETGTARPRRRSLLDCGHIVQAFGATWARCSECAEEERGASQPSHTCPVCGYRGLVRPADRYNICPCCGCEFGNDDEDATHAELRARWVAAGTPWFSHYRLPPVGWNPVVQLREAGLR